MDETKNVNDMSTSGSETEQRENYGQPHFAYFQNSRCEYFPCHKLPETVFQLPFLLLSAVCIGR